jgi:formyltetrahydrofolate deformylase
VLLLMCQDRPGIVARVSGFLFEQGANIESVDQHVDRDTGRFFQRIEFTMTDPSRSGLALAGAFEPVAEALGASVEFRDLDRVPRVAVLASKQNHCLVDLLYRARTGDLPAEIALVASNHPDHAEVCRFFEVPFHHVPIVAGDKASQEKQLVELIASHEVDLVVLARYMQILSDWFIDHYPNRIINIHHSLLPSFVGAQPYRQAYDRGVKLVGATAHYVTAELDQGPIIAQDVAPISHRDSLEEIVRKGKDIERLTLARAVRRHLEAKVIAYENRTVVFP